MSRTETLATPTGSPPAGPPKWEVAPALANGSPHSATTYGGELTEAARSRDTPVVRPFGTARRCGTADSPNDA